MQAVSEDVTICIRLLGSLMFGVLLASGPARRTKSLGRCESRKRLRVCARTPEYAKNSPNLLLIPRGSPPPLQQLQKDWSWAVICCRGARRVSLARNESTRGY